MTRAPKFSKLQTTEEPTSKTLWNLILNAAILKFVTILRFRFMALHYILSNLEAEEVCKIVFLFEIFIFKM
jgi:hypothetical protein